MNRKKLNFSPCPAPGQHLAKYPARSSPTSSGLKKVKSSARCCSKNFRSPAAKAAYDRCAKRRGLHFGISLLSPLFCYPCFHEFFYQCQRQRVIRREANGPLANLKTFQIIPKIFQRSGIAWIERAVIRPSAQENQGSSIQAKRRNSITDALLNLGCYCVDDLAKFLQRDLLIRAYACEVFVNCSRLSFPRRHKDSKGSFPCVSSLQFADVDLLHLHHRIHHSSGLFRVFVL